LDVYNVQSGDISTNNSAVTVQSGASDFKGTLVGIIKGQEKSFALIRDEQNFFILSEGETDKGLKVEEIGLKDVTIIYQGKKYNLKLASSDKTYLNTQKYSGVEQTNGAGTTKTVVTRKDVEENMSDINGLIRTMYISPYYVGGEFVGYRIARMRMDAFLRKAGIENGDVLVRMNGEKVDTPEKMFELFTRWKDASAVTIDLLRMDQRKTILVEIQ
jgi:general secretion pathway protein C